MINLLKKAVVAAGVSALCFAGAANAYVTSPVSTNFGVLTAPATATFAGQVDTGSTDLAVEGGVDYISFSIDSSGDANSSTVTGASGVDGWGWASFATSLWDSADNTGNLLMAGTSFNFGGGQWASVMNYGPLTFANSPYYIHIDGVSLAGGAASYGGSMTLAPVAAVPEPETYAMLLAGLGLMGFIARRRRQNAA